MGPWTEKHQGDMIHAALDSFNYSFNKILLMLFAPLGRKVLFQLLHRNGATVIKCFSDASASHDKVQFGGWEREGRKGKANETVAIAALTSSKRSGVQLDLTVGNEPC